MKDKREIEQSLPQFIGTEQYHKLSIFPVVATDGVAYLAKECEAYWFTDLLAAAWMRWNAKGEEFLVVKMVKNGREAVVTVDDGNENILETQKIEYTDFPLDEIKVYVTDGVMLLPSEY